MTNLGKRTVKAGMWNVLSAVSESVIRLASNLITTHFLLPEAFGLMMFASTIMTAFNLLSDVGLNQSIIREHDGQDERFLQVTWSFKVRRGAFIAICVLAVGVLFFFGERFAPPDTIYADSRLPLVVAIIALVPLMLGAESTAKVVAMRNLEFARIFWVDLFARIMSVLAIVGFAMVSPTVWALLAGSLMANLWLLIASHLFFGKVRMRYVRDADIEKRLWSFGRYIMGSSALTFVSNNADRLILASLMPSGIFGLYAVAMVWVTSGRTVLRKVVNAAGFAAMTEVARTRPQDTVKIYLRIQKAMDGMSLLAAVACMFVGPKVLEWLYPGEFEQVGKFLFFLAPTFLTQRFETLMAFVLALGNSRAQMIANLMRTVFVLIAIPLGYMTFGVKGALLASSLTPMVTAPYVIYVVRGEFSKRFIAANILWAAMVLFVAGTLALTQSLG